MEIQVKEEFGFAGGVPMVSESYKRALEVKKFMKTQASAPCLRCDEELELSDFEVQRVGCNHQGPEDHFRLYVYAHCRKCEEGWEGLVCDFPHLHLDLQIVLGGEIANPGIMDSLSEGEKEVVSEVVDKLMKRGGKG